MDWKTNDSIYFLWCSRLCSINQTDSLHEANRINRKLLYNVPIIDRQMGDNYRDSKVMKDAKHYEEKLENLY